MHRRRRAALTLSDLTTSGLPMVVDEMPSEHLAAHPESCDSGRLLMMDSGKVSQIMWDLVEVLCHRVVNTSNCWDCVYDGLRAGDPGCLL